ncbi:hypothetical protein SKAU_G00103870 [Synaphobranchus kaupii]|uniref:Uncharacterized protein n=1 Tax=Synaphobranchus kaupii TaxID=118154 RepID=A0A9Q1FYS0_SYNKA|nr:hypothetical protein SKAU_G00103870 [Synaphobranchus kaupii]
MQGEERRVVPASPVTGCTEKSRPKPPKGSHNLVSVRTASVRGPDSTLPPSRGDGQRRPTLPPLKPRGTYGEGLTS